MAVAVVGGVDDCAAHGQRMGRPDTHTNTHTYIKASRPKNKTHFNSIAFTVNAINCSLFTSAARNGNAITWCLQFPAPRPTLPHSLHNIICKCIRRTFKCIKEDPFKSEPLCVCVRRDVHSDDKVAQKLVCLDGNNQLHLLIFAIVVFDQFVCNIL